MVGLQISQHISVALNHFPKTKRQPFFGLNVKVFQHQLGNQYLLISTPEKSRRCPWISPAGIHQDISSPINKKMNTKEYCSSQNISLLRILVNLLDIHKEYQSTMSFMGYDARSSCSPSGDLLKVG